MVPAEAIHYIAVVMLIDEICLLITLENGSPLTISSKSWTAVMAPATAPTAAPLSSPVSVVCPFRAPVTIPTVAPPA